MKKLGFGCMRLPLYNKDDDKSINMIEFKRMIDTYMNNGFNFFDTAYMYHDYQSEIALNIALIKRYPRDSFILEDKLPTMFLKKQEDVERIFNEQLEKTGAGYFDYYLLHNLNENTYKNAEKFKCFDFLSKIKQEGKAKHIGFSFHGQPDLLEYLLKTYPQVEVVLIQINYIDWLNPGINSKLCYEIASKYGKRIHVMEPLKGGTLANLNEDISSIFKSYNKDASIASWAIRYVASLSNVSIVLSGMSSFNQLNDNVSYMKDFKPLNDEEYNVLNNVVNKINSTIAIPCTACQYCVEGCPKKIAIPKYFHLYISLKQQSSDSWSSQKVYYENIAKQHGRASECISCGRCERSCPQHLKIISYLKDVASTFEGK